MNPPIVLLTDFGTADPFTGILRGVLSSIAPKSTIIDLSNEIPPGDILKAAVSLWQAYRFFPDQTIFLCVVDPGVGSKRKPLIVRSDGYTFIGPDNGIFSFVVGENFQAYEINNPSLMLPDPSNTFHGRDIFAPAAAYAAQGIPISEFGPLIDKPIRLTRPALELVGQTHLIGEILYADRFGNLLTSLGFFHAKTQGRLEFRPWLPSAGLTQIDFPGKSVSLVLPGNIKLTMVNTFSSIEPGKCACLIGSSGLLEIAANGKSAANLLNLVRGNKINLQFIT